MSEQRKEFRFLTAEFRAKSGAKPGITGYALRYGKKTTLEPGLNEIIKRGAFNASVARKDECICCFNHDNTKILGRVSAGNLRLKSDDEGLFFDCDLPETSYASDLLANIRAGNISECSFGMATTKGDVEYTQDGDGTVLRTVLNGIVFDVSPVIDPAYGGGITSVAARAASDFTALLEEARNSITIHTTQAAPFDEGFTHRRAQLALEKLKF